MWSTKRPRPDCAVDGMKVFIPCLHELMRVLSEDPTSDEVDILLTEVALLTTDGPRLVATYPGYDTFFIDATLALLRNVYGVTARVDTNSKERYLYLRPAIKNKPLTHSS